MKATVTCRRVLALLTALLLMAGTLTGCGGEDEVTQVTLRTMSILGDEGSKEAYTALLETFSLEHPNVYHIGTVAKADNAYKLDAVFEKTYTASKYPHAVYYYNNTGIEDITDQFVSVEEIRESYPDFAASIPDAVLDSVRADDGKVYCVPFAGRWTAVAVNLSVLNRYALEMPSDWQGLITVAGILSARGITPIANTPDSCAELLELMCANAGASDALSSALNAETPLIATRHREQLLEVFRRYQELCGIRAFPEPMITDDLASALKLAQTVSSGDAGAGMASDGELLTVADDPIDLFNSGRAAMVVIDSTQLGRIRINNCALSLFPCCEKPEPVSGSSVNTGEGERLLVGGFDTGWFITRRAFRDKSVCDSVVAFVDAMTGSAASESFAGMGFLPSADCVSVSDVVSAEDSGEESARDVTPDLFRMVREADGFASTYINSVNSARTVRLEHIVCGLSLGLITPEQAVELAAHPDMEIAEIILPPQPEIPPETVSASDVVSGADTPTGGSDK